MKSIINFGINDHFQINIIKYKYLVFILFTIKIPPIQIKSEVRKAMNNTL